MPPNLVAMALRIAVFTSVFLGLAEFLVEAKSSSYTYSANIDDIFKRQDQNINVVGRLRDGVNGTTPARLEIRQMRAIPAQWNLFILACDWMQWSNQNDARSWYQIAGGWAPGHIAGSCLKVGVLIVRTGIHGVPFIPYNNVQPKRGLENNGYCAHASVLFPTWHRPYVAMIEVRDCPFTFAIQSTVTPGTRSKTWLTGFE
jgi:tyrosinase